MLVFLAYSGSVILSVVQTSLCKSGGEKSDQDIFNVNKTTGAALMFVIMGIVFSMTFHAPTILYSFFYAVFILISMWAGLKALTTGPLAITTMIISFSLIVPCAFGIIALKEQLSIFGIFGLILLCISIFIINAKRRSNGKVNFKWLVYTVLTMISDGCGTVVKKLHQIAFPDKYMIEFMLYSMGMAAIAFIFIMLLRHKPGNIKELIDVRGILSGIANGGSSFISLYLASVENLTVVSPLIAVLSMLASLLCGRIIFKEKLSLNQIIGFCLGIASIVLLKF